MQRIRRSHSRVLNRHVIHQVVLISAGEGILDRPVPIAEVMPLFRAQAFAMHQNRLGQRQAQGIGRILRRAFPCLAEIFLENRRFRRDHAADGLFG